MGENLFRLKDRKGTEMVLGMTEEEVMTSIALKDLRSYNKLPLIWHQIAPEVFATNRGWRRAYHACGSS